MTSKLKTGVGSGGWSPTKIPNLKAWYESDRSVYMDGAVQFTVGDKAWLSCASNSTLQTGDIDFELGVWVYLDSTAANNYLISKDEANREYLLYTDVGGTPFFYVFNVGGSKNYAAAPALSTNTWYFIRAWYDHTAQTVNIQVNNGSIYSTSNAGYIPRVATGAFAVGYDSTNGGYCAGRQDSLYWTKTLSSTAEATALYNSGSGRMLGDLTAANGLGTFRTNCISWYGFNEEDGIRYDAIGTNHLSQTFNNIIDNTSTLGTEAITNGTMEYGAEAITNGSFTSDTSGWTAGNLAVLASVAGGQAGNALRVTNGSGYGYAYQSITTVANQSYTISYYFKKGTCSSGSLYIGTTAGASDIYSGAGKTDAGWTVYTVKFTATTTTTYFRFGNTSNTVGETSFFDEVSVKPLTGWLSGNSAILSSVAGGQAGNALQITNVGASYGYAYQAITTIANQNYTLSFYQKNGSTSGIYRIESSLTTGDIYSSEAISNAAWTLVTINFKAVSTTTYFRFSNGTNTDGQTSLFDEISVKPLTQTNLNGGFESKGTGETLGSEILLNPGFETAGATPPAFGTWTETLAGGTITRDNASPHGGSWCMKVVSPASGLPYETQAFTTVGSTRYKFTFWTKGDGTYAGNYTVYDVTNSTYIFNAVSTGVTAATWTQVTVYFTTASNGVSTKINLMGNDSHLNATVYFDDVSVKAVTASNTFLNWTETIQGSSTVNVETAAPHSGTYAARLNIDGSNRLAQVSQVRYTAGHKYFLSAYLKAGSGTPTAAIGDGVTPIIVTLTTSYALYSSYFTASSTDYIIKRNDAAGNTIYIDDVVSRCTEIPAAAGIAAGLAVDGNLCASLNGSSNRLAITDASQVNLDPLVGDFSYGVAFNLSGYPATGVNENIIYKGADNDGAGNSGYRLVVGVTGAITSVFRDSGTGVKIFNVGPSVVINKWYLAIVTHSRSGNMSLYLNGTTPVATADISGQQLTVNSTQPFTLGADAVSNWFNGRLDGAFFKNRVLTASEINSIFNNGKWIKYAALPSSMTSDTTTYPLSCWNLDEYSAGTGLVTRKDSGSNANNLTDAGNTPSGKGVNYYEGTAAKLLDLYTGGFNLVQTTIANRLLYRTNIQNSKPVLTGDGLTKNLSNAADLIGAGNITTILVFKPRGWGGSGFGRILDNGSFVVYLDATGYMAARSDGITTVNSGAASITLGTAYVATITRTSAGVLNFYINGTLAGPANQASGTPATGSPTYIGNTGGLARGFDGDIDEVLLYTRILNATEIARATAALRLAWGV